MAGLPLERVPFGVNDLRTKLPVHPVSRWWPALPGYSVPFRAVVSYKHILNFVWNRLRFDNQSHPPHFCC
jgi:hypothetical protein